MFHKKSNHSENFLEIADVMIIIIDRNGKVDLINRKGCEILGCSKNDILGKDWFDNFVPERLRDEVKEVFMKLCDGEMKNVKYYNNPIITSAGEERLISWRNTILLDDDNNVIGTLSSGTDITEIEELKKKVKELEEKLKN